MEEAAFRAKVIEGTKALVSQGVQHPISLKKVRFELAATLGVPARRLQPYRDLIKETATRAAEASESVKVESGRSPGATEHSDAKRPAAAPTPTSAPEPSGKKQRPAAEGGDHGPHYLAGEEVPTWTVGSEMCLVRISKWKGAKRVDIRKQYKDAKSGQLKPGRKGISLSVEQWKILLELAPYVTQEATS